MRDKRRRIEENPILPKEYQGWSEGKPIEKQEKTKRNQGKNQGKIKSERMKENNEK